MVAGGQLCQSARLLQFPKQCTMSFTLNKFAKVARNMRYTVMPLPDKHDELIPTRASLLARLKNLEDHDSWQNFFDTYWKLIYGVCTKRGLSPSEAEDVVQETMCAIVKHMPNFSYDRNLGSFKSWLLNMVRWRIADQYRKRAVVKNMPRQSSANDTKAIEEFPDLETQQLQSIWDKEWEQALLEAAIVKTRRTINPKKLQIFDLVVRQQVPPNDVAKTFNISVNQVYLVKHRVTQQIKVEVERLKRQPM
jgi:RNA polymerase sigma factor (sigma-70 family)